MFNKRNSAATGDNPTWTADDETAYTLMVARRLSQSGHRTRCGGPRAAVCVWGGPWCCPPIPGALDANRWAQSTGGNTY
jgi:hypothetical protein